MILRVFSCWLWVSVSHFYTRQTFYQANGLRWAPDAPPQSRYVAASLGWEPRLITCSFCVSFCLFPCEMIRRTFLVCWETILHFFNQSPPLSFFFFFLSGASWTRLCRCCWNRTRIENEERSYKKNSFFSINRYCIFFSFLFLFYWFLWLSHPRSRRTSSSAMLEVISSLFLTCRDPQHSCDA